MARTVKSVFTFNVTYWIGITFIRVRYLPICLFIDINLFIYLFVDIYLLLMINILMLVRGSSLVLESLLISITIISHYTHMEIQLKLTVREPWPCF